MEKISKRELKPLIGRLFKLDIKNYLSSESYENILLEHDFDEKWEYFVNETTPDQNQKLLDELSGGKKIDVYKESFILMLLFLWNNYETKEPFIGFVLITLDGFQEWENVKIDYNPIIDAIEKLPIEQNKYNFQKYKTEKVTLENDDYTENNFCFIIMPINNDFKDVYHAIKDELKNSKIKFERADDIYKPGDIITDILENIKKSEFLIADLTGNNANVFYELGYATALNKKIILITQDEHENKPFDVIGLRTIKYENSYHGLTNLKKNLKNYISNIK